MPIKYIKYNNLGKVWILQHHLYGLGNFINMTPTLQAIFNHTGIKVPVFFESQFVKDFFEGCEFIEFLSEKPDNPPILSSNLVNQFIPDWQYIYHYARNYKIWQLPEKMEFHTHVPYAKKETSLENEDIKNKAVIVDGCANPFFFTKKKINPEVWLEIIKILREFDYSIKIVGGGSDVDFWKISNLLGEIDDFIFDDIRRVKLEIQKSKIVVTNDTGLMHLAGAYKKDTFVIWKDTNYIKNKSPNPNAYYSFKYNWIDNFHEWILKRKLKDIPI